MKEQTTSVLAVWPMDGKFLKSSFQWFKLEVIWTYLQSVMAILVDRSQLKQLLFSIPANLYWIFENINSKKLKTQMNAYNTQK
jgi:hypothetical protein